MGSAYDKINNFSARAIRKLSDYNILQKGRKTECTRLSTKTDVWGNSDIAEISVSTIQAIFIFPPGEMPLIRLRAGQGTQAQTQASSLFFFDILPIEIYVRWEDQIENGDILYFYFLDETGNKMPMVFKILDQKGSVSSQLIWRKLLAAPITSLETTDITPEIKERLLKMSSLSEEKSIEQLNEQFDEECTSTNSEQSDVIAKFELDSNHHFIETESNLNLSQEEKYGHLFG